MYIITRSLMIKTWVKSRLFGLQWPFITSFIHVLSLMNVSCLRFKELKKVILYNIYYNE